MTKAEKKEFILATLEELFPNPPIPLNSVNSYTFTIAVLLSAQSTDIRVNQVTEVLFALAKTPQEMIDLGQIKIQEIIRPVGLSPTKAKNIIALSHKLISEFQGDIPKTLEALETLPGVGHKTASVVMSQIFGEPHFPVDTHIHRLAKRWGLTSGKNVVETEKDLKAFFPKKLWNKLHLQIIFYGRAYCPARGHLNEKCLICKQINES
ncbi:MAG: endonuclease III [Chitinophagales bacterium]|jgi:endonuclease-3|nr:endonuclease III [Chitinophagales bacterium]